jgi:hypothetical protein
MCTMSRANIIRYWASDPPPQKMPLDCIMPIGYPLSFPDLESLNAEEWALLKPIVEKHPEYLTGRVVKFVPSLVAKPQPIGGQVQ